MRNCHVQREGWMAELRFERILVVDDDPKIRQLVELRLTPAGYEVLTAASGEEATDGPPMDEAGQLASWLIHQANFAGV